MQTDSHVSDPLCRKMMQSGSSRPWTEVLQDTLGTNKMDAGVLMAYFQPITSWLEEQNQLTGETLGWPDFNWMPPVPEGYPDDIGKTRSLLIQNSEPARYDPNVFGSTMQTSSRTRLRHCSSCLSTTEQPRRCGTPIPRHHGITTPTSTSRTSRSWWCLKPIFRYPYLPVHICNDIFCLFFDCSFRRTWRWPATQKLMALRLENMTAQISRIRRWRGSWKSSVTWRGRRSLMPNSRRYRTYITGFIKHYFYVLWLPEISDHHWGFKRYVHVFDLFFLKYIFDYALCYICKTRALWK